MGCIGIDEGEVIQVRLKGGDLKAVVIKGGDFDIINGSSEQIEVKLTIDGVLQDITILGGETFSSVVFVL